ncbi:hypothetical protein ACWDZ8_45240, partial [Streptomyces sp. NPDC003233]
QRERQRHHDPGEHGVQLGHRLPAHALSEVMVSRSLQGRPAPSPLDPAPPDGTVPVDCAARAVPGNAATAAPPSAVPSKDLRGTGERFSGCEVIVALQT